DKPEWQESTCATRFAVLQSGGRLSHGRGLQPLSTAVQIQLFCCVGTRSTSIRCGDRAFRGRRFLALEVGPGLDRVRASINRQRSCSRSRVYRNSALENLARLLGRSESSSPDIAVGPHGRLARLSGGGWPLLFDLRAVS